MNAQNVGKTNAIAGVNDKIINEFESATEASLLTNISRTAIINCLSGKSKSSGGFKWEYKNNINDKK